MRMQHVALAFAGWYLMMPPTAGTQGVNTEMPVSQWSRAGVFESWADCDKARQEQIDSAVKSNDEQAILSGESAECDDLAPASTSPQGPPPAGLQ